MDERTLGRFNATVAAVMALMERLQGDRQLMHLFDQHAEFAAVAFLNAATPEGMRQATGRQPFTVLLPRQVRDGGRRRRHG